MEPFESQEAKDAAIDSFDISTGDGTKLDEIMNAEVVEKADEAAETPASTEDTQQAEETTVEDTTTTEEPQTGETKAQESTTEGTEADSTVPEPKTFTITEEDLGNYKSPGELLKAMQEKQSLIERQGKKIQEMIDRQKQEPAQPVQQPATQTPKKPTETFDLDGQENKVTDAWNKYQQNLKNDQYSEETTNALNEFQQENFKYSQMVRKSQEAQAEVFKKKEELLKIKTEHEAAQEKEYREISEFANEYKDDFGLERSPKDINDEYVNWAKNVAAQYYGQYTDNWGDIKRALIQLENRNPQLVERCKVATIPTEPSKDVQNYQKICDLIDYRNGVRYLPDGTYTQATRYNPETRKTEVLQYPSLKEAFEIKRVAEGYYKQKEAEAFNKGVDESRKVAQTRDTSVLSNDSDQHATTTRTVQQIAAEIEAIDPSDPSAGEKLDALMLENEKFLGKSAQGST